MDHNLRPVGGSWVVICISETETVLHAAIARFAAHDCRFVASEPWIPRYREGTPVETLSEGSDIFRLQKHLYTYVKWNEC